MWLRGVILSLILSACLYAGPFNPLTSYNEGMRLSDADAARLQSALASNPEDMNAWAQLLGYYSGAPSTHDPDWSNRVRLMAWGVEHHPEAMSFPLMWSGMPDAIFQQLKPAWVAEVHQHADDANVLRNAAAFLSSQNAPARPGAVRVGPNVQAANLVNKVDPVYPPLAQQARVQGTVQFSVTIGMDGHIQNIQLVSGHPLLVNAARDAVQQYVYRPTLLNGNPVQVMTTVDVSFALN